MKTHCCVINVLKTLALAMAFMLIANCKQPTSDSLLQDTTSADPVKGCEAEWKTLQRFSQASNDANAEDTACRAAGGTMSGDAGCACGTSPGSGSIFDPRTQICRGGVISARPQDASATACERAGGVMEDACMCRTSGGGSSFDPATQVCRNGQIAAANAQAGQQTEGCTRQGGTNDNVDGTCRCSDGTPVFRIGNKTCAEFVNANGGGGTQSFMEECQAAGLVWADGSKDDGCRCRDGIATVRHPYAQNKGVCQASPASNPPPQGGGSGQTCDSSHPGWDNNSMECRCSDGSTVQEFSVCGGAGLTGFGLVGGDQFEVAPPTDLPPSSSAGFALDATNPANKEEALQAYNQCKQRVQQQQAQGGGDIRSACTAAGGFTLGTGCLCEEGRTVYDAKVLTPGSCSAPSLTRVCNETGGRLVENGRGCECGGTTRYQISAVPGEKCANPSSGGGPANPSNPQGAAGGDMRSACASAGGFFLNNQCLCEEGRTVSAASVLTAGSCGAPSLSRVCSATRGQLVENGRGCRCGSVTRYQLSAMPNEMCSQSAASPSSPGAAAPSSPAPAQQYRGDYCVARVHQNVCGVINCNGAQSTCRYTRTSPASSWGNDCARYCRTWYSNLPTW